MLKLKHNLLVEDLYMKNNKKKVIASMLAISMTISPIKSQTEYFSFEEFR